MAVMLYIIADDDDNAMFAITVALITALDITTVPCISATDISKWLRDVLQYKSMTHSFTHYGAYRVVTNSYMIIFFANR
jgi:hypothetical protein